MKRRRPVRPYLDRGSPGVLRYDRHGRLLLVKEPVSISQRMLTLQALRRHNTLNPALHETHRILLRWGEGEGSGLPNPDADIRETHYDPLPDDVQERVDAIVRASSWELLTRKWYRTSLSREALAEELHISRSQLYKDRDNALWYFKGLFEAQGIHG